MRGRTYVVIVATLTMLVVVSGVGNAMLYRSYRRAQDNNPNVQAQRIIDELRKNIALPDETPSILTVVDKTKLTDSEVARNAENGDKILFFQKTGKVVIYRPSARKLISILNLTLANTANKAATSNQAATGNTLPATTTIKPKE